jgi:deazaflavin-dependent oxidoreductase (nitroreductase family)
MTTTSETTRQRPLPLPLHYAFKYLANPLMKAILRSPLHRLVSEELLLLTFTGRKSGRQYTTPVGYTRDGDSLLLTTESPWQRNLRGGADVVVRLQGRRLRARAEVDDDPLAMARLLQRELAEKGAGYLQRRYRVKLATDQPTLAELQEAARDTALVRVTPQAPT